MQLFNAKTLARHLANAPAPDAAKLEILRQWGETIRDRSIETQSETEIEDQFKSKIVCDVLGYVPFGSGGEWSVASKTVIGSGIVDLALGVFAPNAKRIIAPFELKGAKTRNLDAIMPGRAKTPVEQAWNYASDNVGTKWVLLSNYTEIRLYAYGEGKLVYERFDLSKLHQPDDYARFMLLLSADNLLSGKTQDLLEESRRENKDITNRLYADYRDLRGALIDAVRAADGSIDPLHAIRLGQTILDRVLFIAFAEDNGLLPRETLLNAFESANPFNPAPVWQNFLGLFNAIDVGNAQLNIPRYNGGLFAPDAAINALSMPDAICEGFKRLAEYDFASEISVTVLGHIFEQSIADVEQLQAQARGDAPVEKKTTGTTGRRKRDGVVYTPDYVARFIVEQTLGTHCREIFADILSRYAAKGASAEDEEIKWKSAKAEREAWDAYRARLATLRIVDPACGSGVFLIMAFDWLKGELSRVNAKLAELSGTGMAGDLLDPDSEILTNNLFGVDVNSESVEIAKLSLWIKTARKGKVLDSLDGNIRVGDSLIEDSNFAYRSHGFQWRTAFAHVFAEGGFDVVLGNPPYVRQELLKDVKPYLQGRFQVYHGVADLYAYFFERGIRLLKPGGRLGYISSSTFFKTGSGEPLRRYLRTHAQFEHIVDFGDVQIFEGVTTYPAILTMRAIGEGRVPAAGHEFQFWKVTELPKDSFADDYVDEAQVFPQSALINGSWELENPALRALRAKIVAGKPTLKEVYGSPYRGVLTGRNEAFVIDRATRDRLIAEDPKSAEILKPWLEGKDLKRWRAESRDLWVILFKRSWTINTFGEGSEAQQWERVMALYPAVAKWLEPQKADCQKRTDKGDYWWELRACAYYDAFEKPKILYLDMAMRPTFLTDQSGSYCANTAYFLPFDDRFLLGLLNSPLSWFIWQALTTEARGGVRRLFTYHLETLPIPPATDAQKQALADLAEAAQGAAERRYALQQSVTRRIADLAPDPAPNPGSDGKGAKLTTALKNWWTLPDFAAFQREVKKAFKADIPLKERSQWEDFLSCARPEIHTLSAQITAIEADINARVYALFDLTPDEIALLEANI